MTRSGFADSFNANASRSRGEYERYRRALDGLDPPFAFVDLDAFRANAADLERRAAGRPLRLASKSVRVRALQREVLDRSPWRGLMTFTLAESLWLAGEGFDDLLLAYPTADRAALARVREARPGPILMIDSVEHLDLIGAGEPPVRVCLDVDLSWWVLGDRVKVGAARSPVRTPEQAAALAAEIERRPGLELAAIMGYEAQIAGVGDDPPSRLRGAAVRFMQRRSVAEISERRAAVVAAVERVTGRPLIVNGGGTGSVESTGAEPVVTEITAGSGLYAPALFDHYTSFRARPAAYYALPVVRRPGRRVATALGGGYLASGAGDATRLPVPALPAGLQLDKLEGAGEVQTPLRGSAADALRVGDHVYLRHAKAGELCERFNEVHLVEGDRVVDVVPTYRGEGHAFL
jgi:D-serine deaminase-like pyridoxal phosphate-dependent protein